VQSKVLTLLSEPFSLSYHPWKLTLDSQETNSVFCISLKKRRKEKNIQSMSSLWCCTQAWNLYW